MTAPLGDVAVSMTIAHTWVGDLSVVLAAPGGSPSAVIFSRVGAQAAGSFGDSSDLSGTYNFSDGAATNFWSAAAAAGTAVPAGDYRSVQSGGAGQTNPAPVTSITSVFAGLTTGQINGNWTLTFTDVSQTETGSVSVATLNLNTVSATAVDYDGDGATDFNVIRNVGGGSSGQTRWFNLLTGSSSVQVLDWGIASDFRIAGDFDGDLKTDLVIWRPGAAGTAAFYVLNSATGTVTVEPFGQTGDDPTVVGDYSGDGKTDFAVYRAGPASGDQSTWFYRSAPGGPVTFVPWGQNGDFPAPGDYDGDGKGDFVVQRNNGGGQARFWMLFATGAFDGRIFGTPTDVIVPGDYDGDGKTDIATIRGIGGQINWFVQPSSGGAFTQTPWGTGATDFPTQGDYDGDGKTDLSVYRPSATPGASAFYVNGSTVGFYGVTWGQAGDYPVANFNSH